MKCYDPECPHNKNQRHPKGFKDPRCICNKALLIVIPAGEHIHCPVHPEKIFRGTEAFW